MESRKIFKSGKGSYILTLPKSWIQKNGLKEGDLVHIEELSGKLVILARKATKSAYVDLQDLSFDKTVRRIVAYYLANYDILKLKVNTDEQRRAVAFAADMLVGVEIMEDTREEMELMMHLIRPEIEVEKILEKLSNICLSMLSDFMKMSLENSDRKIASSITFRENEVDRFYLFVIRIAGNSKFFRSFARIVERIADHIEIMTEALLKLNKNYEELSILRDVYEIFKNSVTSFIRLDTEMAEETLEKAIEMNKNILNLQMNLLRYSKEEIIHLKTIFDGMNRILAYSSDIAESVIDREIEERINPLNFSK
ncbi:MAG: hypothetical protein DSO00_03140 [Archaeoglobi archaeon]|nr:MAG: hypothetical protein DSO00_03140 [Archaeoglobi archaeon]